MRSHYAEAWILWSRPYGENDSLVGVYTKEFGRLHLYAKGVRKMDSKLKSYIAPFSQSLLNIHIKNNQSWGRIIGGSQLRNFTVYLNNFDTMVEMSWVTELMDRLTPLEQPSLKKYELLGRSLEKIAGSSRPALIKIIFGFLMIDYSGHGLILDTCSECLSVYNRSERYWIYYAGIVCSRCGYKVRNKIGINPAIYEYLKTIKKDAWLLETYAINRIELETLMNLLAFILSHYLPRPLKADTFKKKVEQYRVS